MRAHRSICSDALIALVAAALVGAGGLAASAQTGDRHTTKQKPAAAKPVPKPAVGARPGGRIVPPGGVATRPPGVAVRPPGVAVRPPGIAARPPVVPGVRAPVGVPAIPQRAALPPGAVPPGALRPGAVPPGAAAPGLPRSPIAGRPVPGAAGGLATGPGAVSPNAARQTGLPPSGARGAALPGARGAALPGARQPLGGARANLGRPGTPGAANLRGPGLRPSPLGRPGALTQARPRTAGTVAWNSMRQRYFVPPPRSPGPPPGIGIGRSQHEMRFSGVPPVGEVRFVPNEYVVQVANTVPRAQVEALTRQLGISVVATQSFDAAGRTLYHFRSTAGRDVRDVVRQLEQNQIVAAAQPNYVYRFGQSSSAPLPPLPPLPDDAPATLPPPTGPPTAAEPSSASARPLPAGDPTQYIIDKLQLAAVHQQSRGRGVSVAVIDSEIDPRHPDLQGAITERFDPTGTAARPDVHGTGMAGAIVAKYRLLGVAPEANIVAIKAFDLKGASAEATSFQILKGLDYALQQGVRVINMSFAGPYDVMLERKLQEAYDKGIVLVAAAGNAGPKSPPLYPGADPNVIAVTATDVADKPFTQANRGNYIAVAAPGVDILVPAPGGSYQLTTGTSVAAAHVSGVVALMLEKRPELTPDDVRAILASTGKPLAGAADDQAGAGMIDPLKALTYELPPPPEPDAEAVPQAAAPQEAPQPAVSQAAAPLPPVPAAAPAAVPAARASRPAAQAVPPAGQAAR